MDMKLEQLANHPSDPLSLLQLRVARRADELVRDSTVTTPLNLHCWFIAESEILRDDAARECPMPTTDRWDAQTAVLTCSSL